MDEQFIFAVLGEQTWMKTSVTLFNNYEETLIEIVVFRKMPEISHLVFEIYIEKKRMIFKATVFLCTSIWLLFELTILSAISEEFSFIFVGIIVFNPFEEIITRPHVL